MEQPQSRVNYIGFPIHCQADFARIFFFFSLNAQGQACFNLLNPDGGSTIPSLYLSLSPFFAKALPGGCFLSINRPKDQCLP